MMMCPNARIRRPPVLLLLVVLAWAQGAFCMGPALPDGALATAGADVVRPEEFLYYLESKEVKLKDADVQERELLLREYLVDRKLAAEAKRYGLPDTPEIKAILDGMDRRELPEKLFRKVFFAKTVLEEKDFDPYYAGLTDQADIRIATLSTEAEAREFRTMLLSGESFEKLVAQRSSGNSAQKGGMVPMITPGDIRFTSEEKKAIFQAAPGDVLGPFENNLGQFSVIRLESRKMVEDQKAEIRRDKETEARENKAATAYLTRLNEEYRKTEIEINEEYFEDKETGGPKKPYLAWIRGRYIYPSDLGADASPESHGKRVYRGSLDKMLRSIVAADLARKEGLADDPEYRRKQDAFLVSTLAEIQVQSVFRKHKPTVTEQDMKKYYKENFHPEVYSLWVVINRDRSKVETARKQAISGKNEGEIAKEFSDDKTRIRGGATGPIPLTGFAPEVRRQIMSLKDGKISEVFGMGGKFLIVKILEKRTVPVPPFKEVKDQIGKSLQLQQRAKAAQDYRAAAIRTESVRIDLEKLAALE